MFGNIDNVVVNDAAANTDISSVVGGLLLMPEITLSQVYYSAPVGVQSIVISLSVCVCVCLSVREHISETAGRIFTKF